MLKGTRFACTAFSVAGGATFSVEATPMQAEYGEHSLRTGRSSGKSVTPPTSWRTARGRLLCL
eukprot:10971006-Lingulodinium_polyedra.AAC.1